MTKRKIVFICSICILLLAMMGYAFASSPDSFDDCGESDVYGVEESADLLTESYRIATTEQRAKLNNIVSEDFLGPVGIYTKQIKMIMEELPKDTPNITKEGAIDICQTLDFSNYNTVEDFENDVAQRFNSIAGAPDFDGGSGIHRVIYFLDDDHSKYIIIWLGRVEYVETLRDESEVLISLAENITDW